MVDNLVYLFNKYGIIPSRNRLYNLGGSQPPLLTSMAEAIYVKSGDRGWYRKVMQVAEKELNKHWLYRDKLENHVFDDGFLRYCDHYMNDITSEHESGWDMTSRFANRCMDIAPIDLNCLIYKYEDDLANFFDEEGEKDKAEKYSDKAEKRKRLINKKMWDEATGFYFDFDEETAKKSEFISLAGFFPLWVGIVSRERAKEMVDKLKIFENKGGLATTQKEGIMIGEKQWDYPNGWAPLQLIVVEGLLRYGFEAEAREIAEKWLRLVYNVYINTGKIFEKYDLVECCEGRNERYRNQDGFGWTNAIFLRLSKEFDIKVNDLEEISVKVG